MYDNYDDIVTSNLDYKYYWCKNHKPLILSIEYKTICDEITQILIVSNEKTNDFKIKIDIYQNESIVIYQHKSNTYDLFCDTDFYLKPLDEIIDYVKTIVLFQ